MMKNTFTNQLFRIQDQIILPLRLPRLMLRKLLHITRASSRIVYNMVILMCNGYGAER